MILSDREIRAALEKGTVRITPIPPADSWSSTAIDLRLDGQLSCWDPAAGGGTPACFSPHDPDYDYASLAARYARAVTITEEGYVLAPNAFLLGWTIEKVQLPHQSRFAARVEGKSSLARLGIGVHVTAPTIHAGFGYTGDPQYVGSPIQLEIWNIGPLSIVLKKEMRICQLIFEFVDGTPEKGYSGRFNLQGPSSATGS